MKDFMKPLLITAGALVTLTGTLGAPAYAGSKFAATPGHWAVKAGTNTVDVLLIGGYKNVNNGMNFNGYDNGKMKITVPLGWKVNVEFKNGSKAMPHSAMIAPMSAKGKAVGVKPAFPQASTPNPSTGLSGNGTERFSFVAKKAGTYIVWCDLPGHGIAGMYDTFVVDPHAKAPSVSY